MNATPCIKSYQLHPFSDSYLGNGHFQAPMTVLQAYPRIDVNNKAGSLL